MKADGVLRNWNTAAVDRRAPRRIEAFLNEQQLRNRASEMNVLSMEFHALRYSAR